jgi:molybdopterin synthase catalytic subunit
LKKTSGIHEKGTFTLNDSLKLLKKNPDFQKVGAIAMFVGVVKGKIKKGENVRKLVLEAYEEKANEVLENICDELKKMPGIIDVQIHHFLGEFKVGEELVYVVVAGQHRRVVFEALEKAVERYKKEAPIFKKEHIVDEKGREKAYWVSE